MKMEKATVLIICFCLVHALAISQRIPTRALAIYSITEYIDGYVIQCIDTVKHDTLDIISLKDTLANESGYEKISIGQTYQIKYLDGKPVGDFESLSVLMTTTIVWTTGDCRRFPFFSRNMKGLWVVKKEKE